MRPLWTRERRATAAGMLRGLTFRQVGHALGVHSNTSLSHARILRRELGLRNRVQLLAALIRCPPPPPDAEDAALIAAMTVRERMR